MIGEKRTTGGRRRDTRALDCLVRGGASVAGFTRRSASELEVVFTFASQNWFEKRMKQAGDFFFLFPVSYD